MSFFQNERSYVSAAKSRRQNGVGKMWLWVIGFGMKNRGRSFRKNSGRSALRKTNMRKYMQGPSDLPQAATALDLIYTTHIKTCNRCLATTEHFRQMSANRSKTQNALTSIRLIFPANSFAPPSQHCINYSFLYYPLTDTTLSVHPPTPLPRAPRIRKITRIADISHVVYIAHTDNPRVVLSERTFVR